MDYIQIKISDEDVETLAENVGVDLEHAKQKVQEYAEAVQDYATGEIFSELTRAIQEA